MAKTRMGSKSKKMKIDDKDFIVSNSCWGDLESNLLRKILQLVDAKDLWLTMSLVCRWWRSVCWDILFWKDYETLELSTLKDLVGGCVMNINHPQRLLIALKRMMDCRALLGSQRCAINMIIPRFMYFCDQHLIFVAERSPKLKRLMLPDSYGITPRGISKATKNWGEMEEISMGPFKDDCIEQAIQAIGSNCKKLGTLCIFGAAQRVHSIMLRLNEHNSQVIANSLSKLRVFSVNNTVICKSGVWAILQNCKQLTQLNLIKCSRMVDTLISAEMISTKALMAVSVEERRKIMDKYRKWIRQFKAMKALSVEIKKNKIDNCIKWSVNLTDRLYSLQEVVDQLWCEDL